jgi:hypothetical protein
MNQKWKQFEKQSYLNLETLRKSGAAVKTPVWFVIEEDCLYVRTIDNSGKVKRIRKNSNVRVAVCDMRGKPNGEWENGKAVLIAGEMDARVEKLLMKKYGLMKKLMEFRSKSQNTQYVTIQISSPQRQN